MREKLFLISSKVEKERTVNTEICRFGYKAPEEMVAGKDKYHIPNPEDQAPASLKEARSSVFWGGFERAINDEITQLEKNNTWVYIDKKSLPKGTNILRSKLVFDIKRDEKGNFLKFKARFVACGNSQVEGVDYFDTYASVMVTKSFRILLTIYNKEKDMKMNIGMLNKRL